MSEPLDDARLFGEEDVAKILKRATERQSKRKAPSAGLTLEEIKQVAAEAGIDPRHIADAAREITEPSAGTLQAAPNTAPSIDRPNFWGGPLSVTRETVVDGTIDEFAWEEMVSEARREFNDTGEVRKWSNSREWASSVNNARSHVTITTRSGKSRLQVFWSNTALAAAAWVPALVVSLISLPIVFEELALTGGLAAFVILSVLIMAFSAARQATSLIARQQQKKMDRLLARLEQIARLRAAPGLDVPAADLMVSERTDSSALQTPENAPSDFDEWGPSDESDPDRRRKRTR